MLTYADLLFADGTESKVVQQYCPASAGSFHTTVHQSVLRPNINRIRPSMTMALDRNTSGVTHGCVHELVRVCMYVRVVWAAYSSNFEMGEQGVRS